MFSMYEKYIYEYKKILNKLSTSCRDTEATVQESLDQIFVINRDLKNTIKNIESSNATNQIAVSVIYIGN